ncbi:MAG: DUF3987 domain-containing protein [Bauldia sp.]|nr:DUF3987 domain-containing protein [Bauldia sp.]MCW5716736.1 DUF3987 domain-containing protein [Bauldia sp.]
MYAPEPFVTEQPQPLYAQETGPAPFPVHALGVVREVVEAVQKGTLAPVEIPAASALAVASLCVQGFADVETLGGTRPVSLFFLTIAESGERKSSCDAPIIAAVREHERAAGKELRRERMLWENDYSFWKVRHDKLAKMPDRERAKAELAELGPSPRAPRSVDRIVTEPTYEGLTRLYAEGQPSLGLFSDEGGQFLGGHAMGPDNRQKTLAAFNDLWQGNPIRRTRQGEGSIVLPGRRLAIHLMVQPLVAQNFMADDLTSDSGFLPRFLMCQPVSTIGTRLQALATRDEGAIQRFRELLSEILNRAMPVDPDTGELQLRTLRLSHAARELLAAYADEVEVAQREGAEFDSIRGHASKSAEQAARIAGVLTLVKNLDAQWVGEEEMVSGIELAMFYLNEALRISNAAAVSVAIKQAERLRVWLLQTWKADAISFNDLQQRAPVKALRNREALLKAIARLLEEGWLAELPSGTKINGVAFRRAYKIVRPPDAV